MYMSLLRKGSVEMKAYIITRTFEVPTSFEDDLLVTEIVGCTLEKTKAEDWCDRAVKQEIYSDSQFNITEIEIDKLPNLSEDDEHDKDI